MFNVTEEQVYKFLPKNEFAFDWYESLSKFLPEFEINTPLRVAAFMSQCFHESGGFKHLRENLNYRAESLMKVWPRHFPTAEIAAAYARQPERIANRAYANRMGNGPEESGDGWRYAGKGIIQLTGKNNYIAFADAVELPLEEIPDYLVSFDGAVHSACWYWDSRKINDPADKQDIKEVTRRINGGYIGLEERVKLYNLALTIFK